MNTLTHSSVEERFEALKREGLKLNLTRGKPSAEQLELSWPLLRIRDYRSPSGDDCRNYGPIEGLSEARELFGGYLGVPAKNVFVQGPESLRLMHDVFLQMYKRDAPGGISWERMKSNVRQPYMLCPVPGYDRHHTICRTYGIGMRPVPMTATGPDMDVVEDAVRDPCAVAMWCVPKYDNPTGITYSHETVERLARMETANPGFRLFWDLAYQEHTLEEKAVELPEMLSLCAHLGHLDRPFIFGSTSKVTFASSGVAMLASSDENLAWFRTSLFAQTIGPDRLNQLRHVLFLQSVNGIRSLMQRHRAILKPKFDEVDEILTRELGGRGLASWTKPRGGYFVSLYVPGRASEVVRLAGEMGVELTPAGAAYPIRDEADAHIRLAPTFAPAPTVGPALERVAVAIVKASGG